MNIGYWLVRCNWLGLVTGIFMIMLPFLGFWWIARAGEGAAELALSPFDIKMMVAGQVFHTTLIEFFLLAAKIAFLIGGVFLILASLSPHKWWSEPLARFGVMRPFWSVIKLVVMVVIGTFILTSVVPMLVPGLVSSLAGRASGAGGQIQTEIDIPYFSGSGDVMIGAEQLTIHAPVTLELTGVFWFAAVTAGFGIAARIYQRKIGLPAPKR